MRIMRQNGKGMKRVCVVMILLCMYINTACGNTKGIKNEERTECLKQGDISVPDTEKIEESERKEDAGSEAFGREIEQTIITADDLPEEIKDLLNYENWTDDTQKLPCTEEDMKNFVQKRI